ncbi:MAG: hypothetical protein QNJ78_08385 [Gammaproteobacteria bacterium]|nr:hypothetical protein [Gammaproteobacteria bacterium]
MSVPALADEDAGKALEAATVCLDMVGKIFLMPDADCNIASSKHRLDWYPEAQFVCETEEAFDPDRPSALKGGMGGKLVGLDDDGEAVEFPFTAKVACGRTVNALSQPDEVLGSYSGAAFSTSITATKFDFGLREEPQGNTPEDKPDFAIAYGGAGYALVDEAGYPTGHMTQSLTVKEPKKFPKAPLSGAIGIDGYAMFETGATISGRVCGSNIDTILEALAGAGPDDDED